MGERKGERMRSRNREKLNVVKIGTGACALISASRAFYCVSSDTSGRPKTLTIVPSKAHRNLDTK